MSLDEAAAPALVPQVSVVAPLAVSLEMVAIAAGVFAIVTALATLYLPSELLWLLVGWLGFNRRRLRELGLDFTFARRARRSDHRSAVRTAYGLAAQRMLDAPGTEGASR